MPTIPYDPSRDALLRPELRETVFQRGQVLSMEQIAVEAARLAYLRFDELEKPDHARKEHARLIDALARIGFGAPAGFNDKATGSQAFAAYRQSDKTALVAFRGTQADKFKDILGDIKFALTPWTDATQAHSGFAERARALLPAVQAWLEREAADRRNLLLAGHSLGAAIATLAATKLQPARLITIGSPQVGDKAFAESLRDADCLRIVNCRDVVTRLPLPVDSPWYAHAGRLLYVTREGLAQESPNAAAICKDRFYGAWSFLRDFPFAWQLRGLSDHAPINYIRAFF